MIANILAIIARIICGCHSSWVDFEPCTKPKVYYSNHGSHLDALIIWASLPKECRELCYMVAAEDYWTKSFIRRFIAQEVFNVVLIRRKNITKSTNPIDLIIQSLEQGNSVIIFPEGTRNTEDRIGQFQAGLFKLARKKPEIKFVPVYLNNLNKILPKGQFIPLPLISHITFGAPVQFDPDECKSDFLDRAKSRIETLRDI